MYISDFWCGVVIGVTGCIVALILLIAIASKVTVSKAKRKK